jgi:hypothetical protein
LSQSTNTHAIALAAQPATFTGFLQTKTHTLFQGLQAFCVTIGQPSLFFV